MMRHPDVANDPPSPPESETLKMVEMVGDAGVGKKESGERRRRRNKRKLLGGFVIRFLVVAAFALLISSCYLQIREIKAVSRVGDVSEVRRLASEDDHAKKRRERGKAPLRGRGQKKTGGPCQPIPEQSELGTLGIQQPLMTSLQQLVPATATVPSTGEPPEEEPAPKRARGPSHSLPQPVTTETRLQIQGTVGKQPLTQRERSDAVIGQRIVQVLERALRLCFVVDRPGERSVTRFQLASLMLMQTCHVLRSGIASNSNFSLLDQMRASEVLAKLINALRTASSFIITHETDMPSVIREMMENVQTAKELLASPDARGIFREGAFETVDALNLLYDQASEELYWQDVEISEIQAKYQQEMAYISKESEEQVQANQRFAIALERFRREKKDWEARMAVLQSQAGGSDPSMHPPEPVPPQPPVPPPIFPAEGRVDFLRNYLAARMLDLLRKTVDAAEQCTSKGKGQEGVILMRNVCDFAALCLGGNARVVPLLVRHSVLDAITGLEDIAYLRITWGDKMGVDVDTVQNPPPYRSHAAANVSGLIHDMRLRLEGVATVLPLQDSRALAMLLTGAPMTLHVIEEVERLSRCLATGDNAGFAASMHNIWMTSQSQERINSETAKVVKLPHS